MLSRSLINVIAVLFFAFILFVIYAANTGIDLFFFSMLRDMPYGDKLGHFSLIGMLTYIINQALGNKALGHNRWLLIGSISVFVFITLEEISQHWMSNRTFDLVDLMCNYIGIFIGSLLSVNIPINRSIENKKSSQL